MARLALGDLAKRLKLSGVRTSETRFELIGIYAVHKGGLANTGAEPADVRIHVAGRAESLNEAIRIGNEMETLYTNGPADSGRRSRPGRSSRSCLP